MSHKLTIIIFIYLQMAETKITISFSHVRFRFYFKNQIVARNSALINCILQPVFDDVLDLLMLRYAAPISHMA